MIFEEIEEGFEINENYKIGLDVFDAMVKVFHDDNKIHVQDEFARKQGFNGKVMHGAILNGFLSHFIGVKFPGERSLLHSVDLRYLKPSYLEDEIKLKCKVVQKVAIQRVLILNVELFNLTQDLLVARGRVQVAIL